MAIRSREQRERERRRKAKKNRSQLLGATQGGQRRPMQQGYTTTKVEPPKFRESSAGADIMQAGQAYKGAKGLHDFTMGKEAYTDAAGKVVPARAPWTIGGESIGDKFDNYFKGVDRRIEGAKSLFDTQPSPQELAQLERANVGFSGNQGLLGPKPPPELAGINRGYNVADLTAARTGGGPLSTTMQFQTPTSGLQGNLLGGADSAFAGAGAGAGAATGMSSLNAPMNAAASFGQGLGGEQAISNLLSGGGAPQGMEHLVPGSSIGGWGNQAANLNMGGSAPFGTTGADGLLTEGTSTAGSGLQGGGGHPWLSYANIGKDLIMGGPGSEKITGSTWGDAAIRAPLAYFTMGLSEIPYAFI